MKASYAEDEEKTAVLEKEILTAREQGRSNRGDLSAGETARELGSPLCALHTRAVLVPRHK